MTIRRAEKWIKEVFSDDILKEADDGNDKGYMRLIPLMSSRCVSLWYNYYTGESQENTSSESCERSYIELSAFAKRFHEIIDEEKSAENNIKAMIESTLNANNGKNDTLTAYFNLCLDRIKYPNFVDIRIIFHELYKAISFDPDKGIDNREQAHKEINKACSKFEKFVSEQEDKKELAESSSSLGETRYAKEFFSGK